MNHTAPDLHLYGNKRVLHICCLTARSCSTASICHRNMYSLLSVPKVGKTFGRICAGRVGEGVFAATGCRAATAGPGGRANVRANGDAGTHQHHAAASAWPRPPTNRDSIGTIRLSAQTVSLALDGKHHMVK